MHLKNSRIVWFFILTLALAGCKKSSPSEPSAPSALPPAPTSISPTKGPVSGGTAVTISGSRFVSGASVKFGDSAATGVSVSGTTSIAATTPAHSAGAVDVVVTNPDGQSGRLTNGFTYEEEGQIKLGLWKGTLPSAPRGSGELSFRVTSQTSLTFLSSKVPVFPTGSGCSSTWNQAVAIDASGAFKAELTQGSTSLTFKGKFESNVLATGTVTGVCKGSLMFLGQTFKAEWYSN